MKTALRLARTRCRIHGEPYAVVRDQVGRIGRYRAVALPLAMIAARNGMTEIRYVVCKP